LVVKRGDESEYLLFTYTMTPDLGIGSDELTGVAWQRT
jgi:hypothetical protein